MCFASHRQPKREASHSLTIRLLVCINYRDRVLFPKLWGGSRLKGALGIAANRRKPIRDRASELQSGSHEEPAMPLFDHLYNFAHWLARNRDEGEDLVQEAYAKALKGFSSFRLRAYLLSKHEPFGEWSSRSL